MDIRISKQAKAFKLSTTPSHALNDGSTELAKLQRNVLSLLKVRR